MLQVHACKPGAAVHRARKPHRARPHGIAAACGNAGRRFLGKVRASHALGEPRPPALGKHAPRCKTRDALKPRQRHGVGTPFFGKIEIRDHDDECLHERVF